MLTVFGRPRHQVGLCVLAHWLYSHSSIAANNSPIWSAAAAPSSFYRSTLLAKGSFALGTAAVRGRRDPVSLGHLWRLHQGSGLDRRWSSRDRLQASDEFVEALSDEFVGY